MHTTTGLRIVELDRERAATASREVFAGLSSQSRFLRFHTGMPTLPARMQEILDRVDGISHVAIGARAETGWIGIARFIRTGPGEAELSIAVVDDWQGRGVGRALMTAARDHASALGYRRLQAEVLAENGPALALVESLFCVTGRHAAGGVLSLDLVVAPSGDCAAALAS